MSNGARQHRRRKRTKVGHDVPKFSGRDEAVAVLIKDLEGFLDLLLAVRVLHFARHHGQEFREIDRAVAVGVHFVDLGLVRSRRERSE